MGATTPRLWVDVASSQLDDANLYFGHGTDNAHDEAVWLVFSALGLDFNCAEEQLDESLGESQIRLIEELLSERIQTRKPLAYLLKEAWFSGLQFYVDERVLIPRSPFAELISEQFQPWVEARKIKRILEIGTGCGCMAIAAAKAFPEAQVDAADISSDALDVAKINIERFQLADRIHLIESDVFTDIPLGSYDLIISNPPYVPPEYVQSLPQEYGHEPALALEAGGDGLVIVDEILARAPEFLNDTGVLVIEVGESQPQAEAKYAHLPLIWLEFEFGGEGVFLLNASDLK